jgi:3-deoxy-D-manno-octulosonate 8-phosphate phosphatase (KDO 8-P phosphatase)
MVPEESRISWRSVALVVFDFDGVFTDNTVWVSEEGVESVRCSRSDGLGLARLRLLGIPAFVISTEANPVVGVRARKLQLPCEQDVSDKGQTVRALCDRLQVEPEHTVYLGNDINDIPAFQSVGIPVAVADAFPEVDEFVVHHTQKPGGFGAVREICDLIFAARTGRRIG